jgi:hypothetical protein
VALPAIFLSNQPVRAKLARYTAAAAKSALLRQDLLEVASEYERLAESAASSPSGG